MTFEDLKLEILTLNVSKFSAKKVCELQENIDCCICDSIERYKQRAGDSYIRVKYANYKLDALVSKFNTTALLLLTNNVFSQVSGMLISGDSEEKNNETLNDVFDIVEKIEILNNELSEIKR